MELETIISNLRGGSRQIWGILNGQVSGEDESIENLQAALEEAKDLIWMVDELEKALNRDEEKGE